MTATSNPTSVPPAAAIAPAAHQPADVVTLTEVTRENVGGLGNLTFEQRVASSILRQFSMTVLFTALLVFVLAAADYVAIFRGVIEPSERLVTENVLMAIIGATIVQLGASVIAIVYSFFKAPKLDELE
ncbi:MAG: hypothetical protein ACKOVA_09955 [Novosphingobium sp.]